jgi:putative inorganic carbon (HCO3(-)) transporter
MYLVPIMTLVAGFLVVEWIRDKRDDTHLKLPRSLIVYYSVWLSLSLATIALTQSFGGWVGLTSSTLFLITFLPYVTRKKIMIIPLVFLFLVTSGFFLHQKRFSHYDRFWGLNSLQTRTQIWSNSMLLLTEHPILGIGLADFPKEYSAYIEKLPPNKQPNEKDVLRPHNLYLDFWLETGILGLAAFIWIVLIFYQHAFFAYTTRRSLLVIPAAAALFAILMHGFVDTPYFKNDLSVVFWFLITIEQVVRHKP